MSSSNNPRQLFVIFLIAVFVLAFFLITLQQIGTPASFQSYLALSLLVAIYPVIGIMARTMQLEEFQTAGRRVGRTFGGMAIAVSLISGSAFVTLSGEIFLNAWSGMVWISALILGLAIASIALAPAIAFDKSSTLPQFLTSVEKTGRPANISSRLLRLTSLFLLTICSMALIVGQLDLVKIISATFIGIPPKVTIICGLLAVLFCLLLGGMRALTWVRVGLYVVVAAAFLIPIIWISILHIGNPVPHLSYGTGALGTLNAMQHELSKEGITSFSTFGSITENPDSLNFLEIIPWLFCVTAGAAAMPHVLQHFSTIKSPSNARFGGNWAMLFLLIVLCAAPAYAAYITLEIYNSMIGLPIGELPQQAPWMFSRGLFEGEALATICGQEVVDMDTIILACGGDRTYQLIPADISIHGAMIMLASANIADLPPLVTILISVGAVAAIFSTVDGLLLVVANAIAQDGYHKLLRRRAPRIAIMFASRLILVAMTGVTAYLALAIDFPATLLIVGSFALVAAGIFPAMITKALRKNIQQTSLLSGMILGSLSAAALTYGSFWGLDNQLKSGDEIAYMVDIFSFQRTASDATILFQSGFVGMLIGFAAIFTIGFALNKTSKRTLNAKN